MPVFEYRCTQCGAKFSLLVGVVADDDDDACPKCSSNKIEKLVSRFRRGRSEDARMDEIADRVEGMGEPDSPAAMRQMVREMGRAADDDMSDDLEEMFEADMEDS